MKKVIFTLLLLIGAINIHAQSTNSEVVMFGQCMIDIQSEEEMSKLEAEIRLNPYVKVVRLDHYSKRVFILTKNLDELTAEQFSSWFNAYSDKVRCIQIGRHGVDVVKPFPFEGCEN